MYTCLRRTFIAIFFISISSAALSQILPDTTTTTLVPPHGVRWTRTFGGSGDDNFASIVALPAGGFIAVGTTNSTDHDITDNAGSYHGLFVRFDKDGHVVWSKTLGGSNTDTLSSVSASPDGFFYATGSRTISSFSHVLIVKFDINGNTLWTKTLGTDVSDCSGASISSIPDGGCIVTGTVESGGGDIHGYIPVTNEDFETNNTWVAKLSPDGTVQWDNCYVHQTIPCAGNVIQQISANRFAVGSAAITINTGKYFFAILTIIDSSGNKIRDTLYNYGGLEHNIMSIVINPDKTITFAGWAGSPLLIDTTHIGIHGANDFWVSKIDTNFNTIWEKFYGGSSNDFADNIISTSDGNYILTGGASFEDGNVTNYHDADYTGEDAWIIKIDANGNLLWQKTIGGTSIDELLAVAELNDLSIVAVGYTSSNDDDIHNYLGGPFDALLTKIGTVNYIVGNIYVDKNNNGIQDAGDLPYSNGLVSATSSSNYYATTPVNGYYQLGTDTGSYTIQLVTADSNYYNIIPATSSASFNQYMLTDTINFRLVKKADIQDLRVSLFPVDLPISGFNHNFIIKYENKGTIDVNPVTLQVKIDPNTQYVSSSVPFTSSSGDTLTWNLSTLTALQSGIITLKLNVKTPLINGTPIVTEADILPIVGDSTPIDNKVVDSETVVGSFDPNDKVEIHGGILQYKPAVDSEYLTYMVMFQNTGTAAATNVYVRDTLAADLDWNSLEMITASYPYTLSIQGGNKLEWLFSNINLPDNTTDEPGSHGYLAFRIKPKKSLPPSDTVKNTAAIYFDFNLPVATSQVNTALNNITGLPSTILQFSAKWSGKNPQLSWDVVNEYSVRQYVIEYSSNGIDFNGVGTVQALNSSNRHQYNFLDAERTWGNNYYRLKIVDIDNKTSYSKIVLLKSPSGSNPFLVIYPNPANAIANIFVRGAIQGPVSITITGLDGKVISRKSYGNLNQIDFKTTLNLISLSKGAYFIEYKAGALVYMTKILIQ